MYSPVFSQGEKNLNLRFDIVLFFFKLLRYDFIGHQETLQDDAELLLKILKLEDDIKFPPSYENMTSPDYVLTWFRTVPLEDRRKLYKLYEVDFRLFGYQKPNELLDGWDKVMTLTTLHFPLQPMGEKSNHQGCVQENSEEKKKVFKH